MSNVNLHNLEVVNRNSKTQLQVSENLISMTERFKG